jgi:hypothetical protein
LSTLHAADGIEPRFILQVQQRRTLRSQIGLLIQ